MKRIPALTGIALVALTVLPLQVAATPISTTIALNTVFSGNTPDGPAPWLIAEFTSSTGSNTGTLVLSSHTTGPDFIQGLSSQQSTVGWAFYLNQAISLSGATCTAGTCADQGASYKAGGFNTGPVPGMFNLAFGWSQGNRFMIGDSATYALTFTSPLTGNPFVENDSNWSSVAHIQGIANNCSGWIVSGDGTGAEGSGPCGDPPPVTVAEPGELGMLSLGLLFVGLLLGLRRRYS
ncbi:MULTISPECIES: hypothetical protein [Rhodanobacter]|uniref:PEP-CTERM sorting domain-containing protein n=1 Tax=Rhodanobacter denitrificans TaxID=666685 RepID=M4NKB9_9GAMM|nr:MULTISPECIES: hypothetical protein [Rhodanobacter]AGG90123.1 hypothetical protein R2APBS1_3050 [Rhodanobacter denitrificans]KZC21165.1 hypothetical protein RHOFW104R3_21885 [Rhodanobacter denitrificans]UJM85511.1 hypothetical protein LRJ86_12070 [Rhodanobacter denitrificans]UJM92935.1 hypothetical protein LRK32_13330 [Rhodanobacter denitrificans]UJM96465.1 hypothetical protein LRK44_13335 [Rhodanobacter denitrificans]